MTLGLLIGMLLGGLCTIVTATSLQAWYEFGWSWWLLIPLVLCGLPVLALVLFFILLTASIILGV